MIYNVIIGGFSVGLTKHYDEAKSWLQHSSYPGMKYIEARRIV
jgi:hypothetical protein